MLAALLALVVALGCATPPVARPTPDPPASDLLNAVLWMQRSVEFKASALTAFALARIRLDQALADPSWTGVPREQTGAYQSLPPAVIRQAHATEAEHDRLPHPSQSCDAHTAPPLTPMALESVTIVTSTMD